MTAPGFRDAWSILPLPAWLKARVSSRVLYTAGLMFDAIGDVMQAAVLARFPGTQDDALPYLGRDRNLDRGPTESATLFAGRITTAFDKWSTAGHPRELLSNLVAYLSPDVPVIRAVSDLSIWDTLSSGVDSLVYASSNWNWDGATKWWRGWIVIYTPSFTSGPVWGSFTWGDGSTYGSSAASTQVRALRNIVKKWKPANVVVPNIIVSFDPTLFDPSQPAGGGINPDGLFGRPYKSDGSVSTSTRPANTAFFGGVT